MVEKNSKQCADSTTRTLLRGCVILREINFLLKNFADRFLAYTHRGKYILK